MKALVFTPDAITTCDRHGHAWKRHEPWKGSGVTHQECWRCGTSKAGFYVEPRPATPAAPAEPGPVDTVRRCLEPRAARPAYVAPAHRSCVRHDSQDGLARNAEIVRLRGEGVPVDEIAKRVGLGVARTYQVLQLAKACRTPGEGPQLGNVTVRQRGETRVNPEQEFVS